MNSVLKVFSLLAAVLLMCKPLPASAELGSPMPAPMPQVSPGANKGPTVEETLMWIKEKVEDYTNMYRHNAKYDDGRPFASEFVEFQFSGCDVLIIDLQWSNLINLDKSKPAEIKRDYAPENLFANKLSLANIDPNEIRISPDMVNINADGQTMTFLILSTIGKTNQITHIGDWNGYTDLEYYRLSNPKALNHYNKMRQDVLEENVSKLYYKKEKRDFVFLHFVDPGIAQRVATAFKHVIKQCQEQRKESPVPQKKELF